MSERRPATAAPRAAEPERRAGRHTIRLHLRFGWAALLGFVALGLALEGLHGFKVAWYLDVASSTRRLMFTLAHAHGTLLALVNIAYALTLPHAPTAGGRTASRWLIAGTVLMPVGFLVGGIVTYGGDPNPGIALAAVGGVALLVAFAAVLRGVLRSR